MAYSLWKTATVINTKHFLLGLVLGTAVIVPLASPQPVLAQSAASKAQGRQGIIAAYDKQEKALLAKDIPTYMSTFSADYMGYERSGRSSNYAQSAAIMDSIVNKPVLGLPIKIVKVKTRIKSITWRGPEAIVMADSTMVMVISKDGRTARTEIAGLSRDFWSPTKDGWKLRQSVEIMTSVWNNGKKVAG